jgi:tetratricopeptide (TPR) repeat protein
MEALEQYFKGRAELDQRTLPSIESARMRLENARTIDPGFALAWAGEALAIMLLIDSGSSYGSIPREEALALAAPLIERAFELAPEDPQVLGVYGLYENNSESFERAEDFYQKSLAINPSSGEVMNWRRMNLGPLDRLHEANELAVKMVEADPMSMIGVYNALLTIHRQPGYDSAQVGQLLDRLERLDKSYGLAARSEVARRDGNHVEAVRYGLASLEADPGRTPNRRALASSLLNLGFRLEALKLNPQLDEEQLALAAGDFETVLRLTRERHAADPESRPDRNELIEATLRARGDPEEVMPIARQIWQEYQDGDEDYQCTFCWPILRPMAWAAQAGEYPEEARQWRTELARRIQETLDSGLVNAGLENAFRYMMDMLDGRHKEAIERLEHGFENNGWRTPYLLVDAEFDPLHPYLEFQTLVARMNETLEEERHAVAAMLCGPDSILVSWEPAPETCAGYPPKNAGSE